MRTLLTLLSAFLLVGVSAGSASAGVFESRIVGKQVATQEIAGISPDVAQPWVVASGEVRIEANGRLKAEMSGLLLTFGPSAGTVGPVVTVFASLVCQKIVAGVPTNEVVASTADVPLSAAGDALIRDTITLPAVCVAPIVLIRINLVDFGGGPFPISNLGIPEPWIAASGF